MKKSIACRIFFAFFRRKIRLITIFRATTAPGVDTGAVAGYFQSTDRRLSDKSGALDTLYKVALTEQVDYNKRGYYNKSGGVLYNDTVLIPRRMRREVK